METVKNISVERLEQCEHLFILYSRATRQPFVSYDKAAGMDQIYTFTQEMKAVNRRDELERYGYLVQIADIPKEGRFVLFINYHALGIDQVVFCDDHSTTTLALDDIQRVDLNRLPKQQRPHLNPALQLTSIYFLQELTRNVREEDLTDDDRQARRDLDEEFGRNLAVSSYMVPIHVKNIRADKPGMRVAGKNFDPVYAKDSEGNNWVPIFSDVTEFEKFNDQNEYQAILISFAQVRQLVGTGMKGALFNPRSQAYRLLPQAMDLLLSHYSK